MPALECVVNHKLCYAVLLLSGPFIAPVRSKITLVASRNWRLSNVLIWRRPQSIYIYLFRSLVFLPTCVVFGFGGAPPFAWVGSCVCFSIVVNQLSLRLTGIAFHFISPLWFNEMKINLISFFSALLCLTASPNDLHGGAASLFNIDLLFFLYFSFFPPRRHWT